MAETVRFRIEGMHCVNCERTVEKALRSVPGVLSASVVLASKSAVVEYDPGRADLKRLVAAVHEAGYEAVTDEKKN